MPTTHEKHAINQIEFAPDEQQIGHINRELEKKLVRKIDWKLIPPLCVLVMVSFLDRVNIGNARLLGLERDLGMRGNQFNVVLLVFLVPYILLEVPANLVMRKMRPSLWLSGVIVAWGAIYLISMYYKRHELQIRVNIFFSAIIIAGATSGFLAYAIDHMDGIRGYRAWRWVFILEGVATVVLALIAYFLVPDWPQTAKFLTPDERKLLVTRLGQDAGPAQMDSHNRKALLRVFGDIKVYLGTLMFIACTVTNYSTSLFIPTILHGYGWSPLHTQVMTIPVYIVAAVLCIAMAYASDYTRHRFLFILGNFAMALVAWVILFNSAHVSIGVRYFAIFLSSAAATAQPIAITWLNNNMGSDVKRRIAAGLQIGIGDVGGIIASNIFITREAPTYRTGYSVGIGALCIGIAASVAFLAVCYFENGKRERGKRDYLLRLSEEEVSNLGDAHPAFRYCY